MAKVKKGDSVKVHYTGKLKDGTVFDTSDNKEPLEFKVGEGKLIKGFEAAVVGMEPGESKTIQIPADKAYGPHHPEIEILILHCDGGRFSDIEPEHRGVDLRLGRKGRRRNVEDPLRRGVILDGH